MEKCIDDKILWDHSMEENFNRVCRYITHCSRSGITFNEEKFSFGREELEYQGFKLTKNSVEPSADMLKSIAEFPSQDTPQWRGRPWPWHGPSIRPATSPWAMRSSLWPLTTSPS